MLPSFIAPLADGGLQLEWSSSLCEIEIEIDPNGDLNYVLVERQENNREVGMSEAVAELEEIADNDRLYRRLSKISHINPKTWQG